MFLSKFLYEISLSNLVCKALVSKSEITLISKSIYDVNLETSLSFVILTVNLSFLFGELIMDFSLNIL